MNEKSVCLDRIVIGINCVCKFYYDIDIERALVFSFLLGQTITTAEAACDRT